MENLEIRIFLTVLLALKLSSSMYTFIRSLQNPKSRERLLNSNTALTGQILGLIIVLTAYVYGIALVWRWR